MTTKRTTKGTTGTRNAQKSPRRLFRAALRRCRYRGHVSRVFFSPTHDACLTRAGTCAKKTASGIFLQTTGRTRLFLRVRATISPTCVSLRIHGHRGNEWRIMDGTQRLLRGRNEQGGSVVRELFLDGRKERAMRSRDRAELGGTIFITYFSPSIPRGGAEADSQSARRRKGYPRFLTLERSNVLPAFTPPFRFYYITQVWQIDRSVRRANREISGNKESFGERRRICFLVFFSGDEAESFGCF